MQLPHLPQQPQLRQQCGVLLGLLRGRLGSLLMLQTETLNLLQDLSREMDEKEMATCGFTARSLSFFLLEVFILVVLPLPILF